MCLSVWASPNVESKPIDLSSLNSISTVLLQISRAVFFPTSKIKGSSHTKKKIKIYIFSKMFKTIIIKFFGFIDTLETQQYGTIDFTRKNPWNQKNIFYIFGPSSPNLAPKLTDQCRSHLMSRVPLQISLGWFFRFRSTLKIKGSSHKKKM